MNKFNEARAKNIEDLKKVVKDIEDGKIKFFQMVAFHTDDEGFAKGLQVIGTMSPYAARGVNESLAEKAVRQVKADNEDVDLDRLTKIKPDEAYMIFGRK